MTDSFEMIEEQPASRQKSNYISYSQEKIVKEVQERDWEDEREHFSSRIYYLLALTQICLSFHGIFGCPLATLNNGGIAFFVPYTIFTIIIGYPIHFMECSLGQYSQLGPVKVWNCVPIARGIGIACICVCIVIAFYNNIYAIYGVMYFARCFDRVLPWSDCDVPSFKNKTCVPAVVGYGDDYYTPGQHYFYDHILQLDLTEHVGHYHFGRVIWQHTLAFFYLWFLVYLSAFQNIRSLERMLPFLVGTTIFCLLVLLSVSIQIHGAFSALRFFVASENIHVLSQLSTWCLAAQQVVVQLGIAQGTLIAYGSYAHHRNKTQIDSTRIICINFFISLGSTIIIWFLLGSILKDTTDSDLLPNIFEDFAYVYIIFTESLAKLPGGRYWCMFASVLILFSCLNSQISIIQTIACVLYDQFPQLLELRCLFNLAICILFACAAILLCTTSSWILLQLFYEIPNVQSRIPIASLIVAAIVLIYGINKYCEDLHFLIDYYPSFVLRFCFFVVPFLMLGLYFSNWILYSLLSDSEYMGFKFILYLILIWIPIWFFVLGHPIGNERSI